MSQGNAKNSRVCLRCGGELAPGTIPDRGHWNWESSSMWRPEREILRTAIFGLLRWQEKGGGRPIRAYRCVQCGTLESVSTPGRDG